MPVKSCMKWILHNLTANNLAHAVSITLKLGTLSY